MTRILDLFAGIGGFSYAAHCLGIGKTTQFVEIAPYCQKVLAKNFPNIPIHNDITTYNPVRGQFDLITFGSPCQDLSSAGKQKGIHGDRSGLFFHATRIIRQVQPAGFIMENVTGIRKWQSQVLNEFQEIGGYNIYWFSISVKQLGGCHQRERWFCIGWKDQSVSHSEQGARIFQKGADGILSTEQPTSICEDKRGGQEQTANTGRCDILSRIESADPSLVNDASPRHTPHCNQEEWQLQESKSNHGAGIRGGSEECDRLRGSAEDVANPSSIGNEETTDRGNSKVDTEGGEVFSGGSSESNTDSHPPRESGNAIRQPQGGATVTTSPCSESAEEETVSRVCGDDDGLSARLDSLIGQLMPPYEAHLHIEEGTASDTRELKDRNKRIQALGNAVTPQQAGICLYLLQQLWML